MIEDSYEDKVEYCNKYIALDGTPIMGEDMLTCISLVNLLTIANQKKDPSVRPLDILNKVYTDEGRAQDFLRERISLMCEMFMIPGSKFRTFGLDSKEKIVAEINRIIDTWIPF